MYSYTNAVIRNAVFWSALHWFKGHKTQPALGALTHQVPWSLDQAASASSIQYAVPHYPAGPRNPLCHELR